MRARAAALVLLGLVLLILVVSAGMAGAQSPGPSPQSFKVEWRPLGEHMRPGVEGYVYNFSSYRVGSVRLRIEVLDPANQVLREQLSWVYGSIDAGGRGYFVLKPPAQGETYRITVESFDLLSRQAPQLGEAP